MAQVTLKAPRKGVPDESPAPTHEGDVIATDNAGRAIKIRRLGPVERMRMFSVLGASNAANDAYLSIASLAFLVEELDGEIIPRPTTIPQVEALVKRLGDDGLDAIAVAAMEHLAPKPLDKELVKNS